MKTAVCAAGLFRHHGSRGFSSTPPDTALTAQTGTRKSSQFGSARAGRAPAGGAAGACVRPRSALGLRFHPTACIPNRLLACKCKATPRANTEATLLE